MIIVTIDSLPGSKIVKVLGLVRGSSVRGRSIGRDVVARMRNVVGGEVHEYTKILAETREQALDRMIDEAVELGANAVLGFRFVTAEVMTGAAELVAYGTAVIIEDESG